MTPKYNIDMNMIEIIAINFLGFGIWILRFVSNAEKKKVIYRMKLISK